MRDSRYKLSAHCTIAVDSKADVRRQPQSNLDGSATLTVTTKLPATLGPGVYKDSVQVNVCFDAACTKPAAHFPVTVPVAAALSKRKSSAPQDNFELTCS
jgi:hypothetical protein